MSSHNISLIVMMVIAIVLLFLAMVLSAMTSSSVEKECPTDDKAHKYSMYTAVVCGLAVFIIAVGLMVYIFRKPVAGTLGRVASGTAVTLQQHAAALQQHAEGLANLAAATPEFTTAPKAPTFNYNV